MTAIRATFEDVKRVKTRKAWQLIFEVSEERYDDVIQALGGSPQSGTDRWVGIARIEPPGKPEAAPEPARVKGGPICKRAVLLCKNRDFVRWWMGWSVATFLENAANYEDLVKERMYREFGITSRAELDHYMSASQAFRQIEADFYDSQQGRTPEALREQMR